jgi:hypothetical protein
MSSDAILAELDGKGARRNASEAWLFCLSVNTPMLRRPVSPEVTVKGATQMLRFDARFAIVAILTFLTIVGAFAPIASAQTNTQRIQQCQQGCTDIVGCGSGTPYPCTAADIRTISKCLASCRR